MSFPTVPSLQYNDAAEVAAIQRALEDEVRFQFPSEWRIHFDGSNESKEKLMKYFASEQAYIKWQLFEVLRGELSKHGLTF